MLTNMRRIRLERGLTQWQVAKQLDVDRTIISLWEHRHRQPSQEQLRKLAEVYGVRVGELLDNKQEVKR